MLDHLVIGLFAACVVAAGVCDLRSLRIPNRVVAAMLALYLPHAASALTPGLAGQAAALAGLVFVGGIGLFAAGLVGGGDVKLLAAVTLWAGPAQAPLLILVTALAGAVLATLLMLPVLGRALVPLRAGWPIAPASGRAVMPYGVAIAAGALAVVPALA